MKETIEDSVKQAKASLKTSLFQWNPDYMSAAMNYERAAKLASKEKKFDQAVQYFQLAAKYYVKKDTMLIIAAANEELARDMIFDSLLASAGLISDLKQILLGTDASVSDQVKDALSCSERALSYYQTELDFHKIVKCLAKTAIYLGQLAKSDHSSFLQQKEYFKKTSLKYFIKCLQQIKQLKGERIAFLLTYIDKAFEISLETDSFQDIQKILNLSLEIYTDCKKVYKVNKTYLNLILVSFLRKDIVAAKQSYSDALQIDSFLQSTECIAAEKLIKAYEDQSRKDWLTVLKSPTLSQIPLVLQRNLVTVVTESKKNEEISNEAQPQKDFVKEQDQSQDLEFLC